MQEVLYRSLGHLAKIRPAATGRLALHRHPKPVLANAAQERPCARHMLSLDDLMPSDDDLGLLLAGCRHRPGIECAPWRTTPSLASGHPAYPSALADCSCAPRHGRVNHRAGCADSLQLQQGTVRIRLHRARLSVRKEMNRLLSGSSPITDACRAVQEAAEARDPGTAVPTIAAVSSPTSPIIWMAEWSRHLRTDAGTHRGMPRVRGVSA